MKLCNIESCFSVCSEEFNMTERQQSYTFSRSKNNCDVCVKKGKAVQHAVVYCTDCSKKYCKAHEEVL